MAEKFLSSRSELGHGFLNAMWIAGFLAAVQIAAVALAIVKRPPASPASAGSVAMVEPGSEPVLPAPRGVEVRESASITPPPAPADLPGVSENPDRKGDAGGSGEAAPSPVRTAIPDLTRAVDSVNPIEDEILERLVLTGVELRGSGDHESALKALKDAELNLPEHPRILGEIAVTLSMLDRFEEAAGYWKKLSGLGVATGGDYHTIAEKILKGEPLPPASRGKVLQLGEIRLVREPASAAGEWIHLMIPIVGDASSRPSGRDMNLRVYFYDRVGGGGTEPTTAKITYEFPSKPYDWQEGGVEEIEVIYHQPARMREVGERSYLGYVIELDYRDQLQDVAASAPELRRLRFQPPKRTELEMSAPQGPDGSLFPSTR